MVLKSIGKVLEKAIEMLCKTMAILWKKSLLMWSQQPQWRDGLTKTMTPERRPQTCFRSIVDSRLYIPLASGSLAPCHLGVLYQSLVCLSARLYITRSARYTAQGSQYKQYTMRSTPYIHTKQYTAHSTRYSTHDTKDKTHRTWYKTHNTQHTIHRTGCTTPKS